MITAAELRELLHYDPETGVFTRIKIVAPQSRIKIGDVAGSLWDGYWRIKLGGRGGRSYAAHRLAWLYMTGSWPEDEIDHANLNSADNRWENLREACRSTNIANTRRRSDNASGFKGVYWSKELGKWRAEITVHKKRVFLGSFSSPEDAHASYARAARDHYGEFARLS